jgi:shikimate dehydrogenase
MTDRYGVVGHPISHSKSPVIHRLFAAQTGQDIAYEAYDIGSAEFPTRLKTLAGEGIRGLNITVPYKEDATRLVDRLTDRAHLAGAVNTVTVTQRGKLDGDNTDGVGLLTDLRDNLGLDLKGWQILVLGAGGATRGIVPALLGAGPEDVRIANRTVDRARELARAFSTLGDVSACRFDELGGQHFDLVINATSAGLQGEVPPFPPSICSPDTVCYDLSYAMTMTPFVAWAKQHGSTNSHQGWGMLVEQAAEAFLIWRGVRPDTQLVRAKLPG